MPATPSLLADCNLPKNSLKQWDDGATSQLIRETFADPLKTTDACSDKLADFMAQALAQNSKNLAQESKKSAYDTDFDLLIVGAGVHAAILSRTLSILNPNIKLVIVDKDELPSRHFRTHAYRLNSPSLPYDANRFPNSPIPLSAHTQIVAASQEAFPVARKIWNHIVFNFFSTNALMLFETQITSVNKTNNGLYEVKITSSKNNPMKQFQVKAIVLSTGLGKDRRLSSPDQNWLKSQEDLAKYFDGNPKNLPKVMTYSELFQMSDKARENGYSIFSALDNKDLAIVGAGDSGKIAIEFLAGFAPMASYINPSTNKTVFNAPQTLSWQGQSLLTFSEFRKPENGTKARYNYSGFDNIFNGVANSGDNFVFAPEPKKTSSIEPVYNKVVVRLSGSKNTVAADYVVLAAGYERQHKKEIYPKLNFFSLQRPQLQYVKHQVPGFGRISSSLENVAQRLCPSGGKCEKVFLVGTAVEDHKLTDQRLNKESLTKNIASIEILGPLSQAFGAYLLGLLN